MWLNFKPHAILSKSYYRELEIWVQGLAHTSRKFDCLFSSFVLELQTSSYVMKVSLLRAWNLSPRFGSHELKFLFFIFILYDRTSTLKLLYEGLVAESFKSEPKAWLTWAEILILSFLFFVIELQTPRYFMKVLLPRTWNLSPRLGLYE